MYSTGIATCSPTGSRPTSGSGKPPTPDGGLNVLRLGVVTNDYYSDRVSGRRARDVDEIGPVVWRRLVGIVQTALNRNLFAQSFPEPCPDGAPVAGTDQASFWAAFEGDLPELDRSALNRGEPPSTLAALDLVEFASRHVSEPKGEGTFHEYFSHYHLEFDPLHSTYWAHYKLRDDVNRLFGRNGLVYELNGDSRIVRHSPQPALEAELRAGLPATADPDLDELLARARRKFLDKDPVVRREALEVAWDGFERIKTIRDPGDKKQGSKKLIAAVTNSPAEAAMMEAEMLTLTNIGNDFRIRHHETGKEPVTDHLIEPFFARIYSLLHLLHPGVPPAL